METQTESRANYYQDMPLLVINKSLMLTSTAQLLHIALKFVFIGG